MTEKQQSIVDMVKAYYKEHGYPVTQKYLADKYGCGTSAMMEFVNAIVKKGYLKKTPSGQVMPK